MIRRKDAMQCEAWSDSVVLFICCGTRIIVKEGISFFLLQKGRILQAVEISRLKLKGAKMFQKKER